MQILTTYHFVVGGFAQTPKPTWLQFCHSKSAGRNKDSLLPVLEDWQKSQEWFILQSGVCVQTDCLQVPWELMKNIVSLLLDSELGIEISATLKFPISANTLPLTADYQQNFHSNEKLFILCLLFLTESCTIHFVFYRIRVLLRFKSATRVQQSHFYGIINLRLPHVLNIVPSNRNHVKGAYYHFNTHRCFALKPLSCPHCHTYPVLK